MTFFVLSIVGFIGMPAPLNNINLASGSFLLVFRHCTLDNNWACKYSISRSLLGIANWCDFQVAYRLVTEAPSTRLRIKTVVIARIAYNVVAIGANVLNPPILNPLAWNLCGRGAFMCTEMSIWSYFRLPETKDLSMAEIDKQFEEGTSVRKCYKT